MHSAPKLNGAGCTTFDTPHDVCQQLPMVLCNRWMGEEGHCVLVLLLFQHILFLFGKERLLRVEVHGSRRNSLIFTTVLSKLICERLSWLGDVEGHP